MKLERILQGTAGSIHATITQDGVAANPDPDDATVTLTRDSTGAELGPYDAYDTGTGTFTHTLSPSETALLDGFTAAWTFTIEGYEQTVTTRVEVVGGFVFSLADARATSGLNATNNDQTYRISNEAILDARNEVEDMLEHELGFALAPRFTLETLSGDGAQTFMLKPHLRLIRSATVGGTALTDADIATISLGTWGTIYYPGRWTAGYGNVVIGYEHGADASSQPANTKRIALALAKRLLTGSPADDRATTMSTEEQTTTFYVPGSDEPFDVPAANRYVRTNTLRTGVA